MGHPTFRAPRAGGQATGVSRSRPGESPTHVVCAEPAYSPEYQRLSWRRTDTPVITSVNPMHARPSATRSGESRDNQVPIVSPTSKAADASNSRVRRTPSRCCGHRRPFRSRRGLYANRRWYRPPRSRLCRARRRRVAVLNGCGCSTSARCRPMQDCRRGTTRGRGRATPRSSRTAKIQSPTPR